MKYFPLFLKLDGGRIVIAGGGEGATQKLRLALKTSADIDVFAAEATDEIVSHAAAGRIRHLRRSPEPGDFDGATIAYIATGDDLTDAEFAASARAAGVPVNVVDRADLSDFITPAIVDRDPVIVAIGTEGTAPVLARSIKARIEAMLPAAIGQVARMAESWRERVHARLPDGNARRRFWQRLFDGDGAFANDRTARAATEIRLGALLAASEREAESLGSVSLVGAGPGDPELLTLKARRRLHDADVVLHDRLVDPAILELARREARFIPVGKSPGGPSVPQERINRILVAEAEAGNHVVRLKGGDPLVFGRADEEIAALDAAGIPFEIIPGITAASAAAASAGISLTRRGRNTAFTVVTAHDSQGYSELDWQNLARPDAAFAIYMGVAGASFVEERLLRAGADPATPVIVVERASRPDERVVETRLGDLGRTIRRKAVRGPAIIFVGIGASARQGDRSGASRPERVAAAPTDHSALAGAET